MKFTLTFWLLLLFFAEQATAADDLALTPNRYRRLA